MEGEVREVGRGQVTQALLVPMGGQWEVPEGFEAATYGQGGCPYVGFLMCLEARCLHLSKWADTSPILRQ